jgi:hypothetical protein
VAVILGAGTAPAALRSAVGLLGARLPGVRWHGTGSWMPQGWKALDPESVWDQVAHCGRLVTAAGITLWEAAAVGIPVVAVAVAANQAGGAEWAGRHGVPVVRADSVTDATRLADDLAAALERARPLPRVADGSEAVVRALTELAA